MSLLSINNTGLKIILPPNIPSILNRILTIFGSRNSTKDNKSSSSGSNSITITKSDVYLGITTVALLVLCFWQRTLSRRQPPPAPRKELPARPALRILFQPDNDVSAPSPSRSSSSPPPLYSPSSQQRRQHGRKDERYRTPTIKDIDNRPSVSFNNRVGKEITVDERLVNNDRLRTKDNVAQDEPIHTEGIRHANITNDTTNTTSPIHSIYEGPSFSQETKQEPQPQHQHQHRRHSSTNSTPPHSSFSNHHLPDSFAPLLSSSQTVFLPDGITPDLLHALHLRFQCHLHPNRSHPIPLLIDHHHRSFQPTSCHRPQITLAVPPISSSNPHGCRITAVATVGSDDAGSVEEDLDPQKPTRTRSSPMVRHAGVVLDPPLPLVNVAPTLVRFPTLFDDEKLGMGGTVGIWGWWQNVWNCVGSYVERMLWILESHCQIHLGKISVAPMYKGQCRKNNEEGNYHHDDNDYTIEHQYRLKLSFSGHVLLFNHIPIPFLNISLPTFLIPQPHALLCYLLTDQPLASATLHHNRIDADHIALALLEAVDVWEVDVEAVATPPALGVELTLPGGLVVGGEVMHGRDVNGEKKGGGGGSGGGIPESFSADTLSSWSTSGVPMDANGTTVNNGGGNRFRRHKGRNVGSRHSVPLPKPFDSNTLVPWKLDLSVGGKITKDRVNLRVSTCTAVHDPYGTAQQQRHRRHESSSGIKNGGSKISFSGNLVLCKPDPFILDNLRRSTASSTPNLAQAGVGAASGGLAGTASESDGQSVCSILLFPQIPPSKISTSPSSSYHYHRLLRQLLQYDYAFDISEDTHLDAVSFSMGASHPMLKGGTMIATVLESIYAHGSLMARENALMDPGDMFRRKRNILKHLPAVDITAGIENIFIPEESNSYSDDGQTRCVPDLNGGRMKVRVVGGFDGEKAVGLSHGTGNGSLSGRSSEDIYVAEGIRFMVDFGVESIYLHNESIVPEFPELDIFYDQKLVSILSGSTNGTIALHLRPQPLSTPSPTSPFNTGPNVFNPLEAYEIDFSGSTLTSRITEANTTLGHRRIIIPTQSTFGVTIVSSVVDMAFDGNTQCEFHWDFQGSSPFLQVTKAGSRGRDVSTASHEEREQVPILISSLRQGRFNLNVSGVGGLTVTQAATSRDDREGLYDWKFFNAIVSPDEESPGHIMKVLHDKRTVQKILSVVKLINADLEKGLSYVVKQVWRAKEIFDNEGVSDPGKAIPHHKMARLLCLFLCDDVSRVDEFLPIIRRVVAGEGLDVVKTKELIRHHLSIYDKWAPEIDRAVGWAEVMLGAATEAPKPFVEYDVCPLSELPQHKARFVGIPSAKEVYACILKERHLPLDKAFSNMVSRIAPYMGFKQIVYILQVRPPTDWQPSDLRRIRYVYSVKKKVLDISESYGGLSFLPQSFFVSVFVGEATRASLRARDEIEVRRGGGDDDEDHDGYGSDVGRVRRGMETKMDGSSTAAGDRRHTLRQRRVPAPIGHQLGVELSRVKESEGLGRGAYVHRLSPAGRVAKYNDDITFAHTGRVPTLPNLDNHNLHHNTNTNTATTTNNNNTNHNTSNGSENESSTYRVGDSLLGPHDVAILLHAGLTSSMKSSTVVQLNQRMLLDLMASQPRIFAVATLAELGSAGGQVSPRGLSSALMALLELDQSSFTEFYRLDMHKVLEGWMPGLKIPRREDYLAGGRWARQTYYTAIFGVAKNILDDAEVYMAFKGHVQRVRHNLETDPVPTALEKPPHTTDDLTSTTSTITLDTDHPPSMDADDIRQRPPWSSSGTLPPIPTKHPDLTSAIRSARSAIEEADRSGTAATTRLSERPSHTCERCRRAEELYRNAFARCVDVLALDKLAFQAEWFKDFYRRNYDALVVKSIFDNVVEDVDEVRQWLDCLRKGSEAMGGGNSVVEGGGVDASTVEGGADGVRNEEEGLFFANVNEKNESDVINAIIDVVFYYEDEREALKTDPLVRLLISNPRGEYKFTIVTAMGVVTEGAQGLELAAALDRLEKKRGVKTIRADTGTARSFEYNGSKIEQAIEKAVRLEKNPFGILGYSQGCANGLTAESMLLSGSPLQQHTLTSPGCNLVCRQLLFSAANGSMHGPAMEAKIHRLIVMCEEFFKYQQGYCSRGFTSLVLQTLNDFMDSAPFHKFMCGGGGTFLHDGCKTFWREAQHLPSVPTCVLRGVLEDHTTPESLEMISNLLSKQAGSALHDSQVHVFDAVGHPVYTQNRNGKILKNCDMGGGVQRTHHWSPLCQEVEFVRTKRDVEQASFICAKDRHVSPWVDVNVRFGIIKYVNSPSVNEEG